MSTHIAIPKSRPDIDARLDLLKLHHQFPRKGFIIEHGLSQSPLFQLPRLVELAKNLPEDQIEYYSGNVGVDQDPRSHPRRGLSISETVRRFEECGA